MYTLTQGTSNSVVGSGKVGPTLTSLELSAGNKSTSPTDSSLLMSANVSRVTSSSS